MREFFVQKCLAQLLLVTFWLWRMYESTFIHKIRAFNVDEIDGRMRLFTVTRFSHPARKIMMKFTPVYPGTPRQWRYLRYNRWCCRSCCQLRCCWKQSGEHKISVQKSKSLKISQKFVNLTAKARKSKLKWTWTSLKRSSLKKVCLFHNELFSMPVIFWTHYSNHKLSLNWKLLYDITLICWFCILIILPHLPPPRVQLGGQQVLR